MAEETRQAFTSIQEEISNQNHARVYEILQNSNFQLVKPTVPTDSEVLQAEIVALLKLDKPKEALDLLDRQGLNLPFHRAYAYYKLLAYEESLEICLKSDSHEFLLLRAQNYYRIGYSDKATEIYEQLIARDSGNT